MSGSAFPHSSAAAFLQSPAASLVLDYLSIQELSAAEAAGWDAFCVAQCWTTLCASAERRLAKKPRWKPGERPVFSENPKAALQEMTLLLRCLGKVPAKWAQCIRRSSDIQIELCPRRRAAEPPEERPRRGGLELGEQERQQLEPPSLAAVPLAIGFNVRDAISVGIELTARRICGVHEAVMLGVEYINIYAATSTAVYFSPVSGRVFVRSPGDPTGLVAEALPALAEESAEHAGLQQVEARLFVSPSGRLSFGRRCGADKQVEMSGELPTEFLPAELSETYASLAFQVVQAEESASVSIVWVGSELPDASSPTPMPTFESVWAVHEW